MTATGSKVEGFEVLGEDIQNVKVGRIVALRKHENSDHLQICDLDVGGAETIQIVTGAQNVFEGAIVPVAVATAHLPGGVTIIISSTPATFAGMIFINTEEGYTAFPPGT